MSNTPDKISIYHLYLLFASNYLLIKYKSNKFYLFVYNVHSTTVNYCNNKLNLFNIRVVNLFFNIFLWNSYCIHRIITRDINFTTSGKLLIALQKKNFNFNLKINHQYLKKK